jgi:23S rRNA (guanosine2251-2'-O)-methyltransferase
VTKDRPRNRGGNAGKSGGFRGSRETGKPGERQPRREGESTAEPGSEKPWTRGRPENRRDQGAKNEQRGPRDRGRDSRPNKPAPYERREAAFEENGEVWIWGLHAAGAALRNPMRKISVAFVSPGAAQRAGLDANALPRFAHIMEPRDIDLKLPPGAVHQGLAVRCRQLDGLGIADAAMRPEQTLAILDQVTDPQNVGAIFRSAAAFGVGAIIMQTRNAPLAGGALAKAAAGAIETVEEVRAVNISRAIDALTDAGWNVVGLDGSAELTLDQAIAGPEPVAIVMGAEGAGIRHGVAKACTRLARIPMQPGMESLNVSNAAAIAFYEAMKRKGVVPPPTAARAPEDESGFDGEAD